MNHPSPLAGEGGARSRSEWEGEGFGLSKEILLARAKHMRANPTDAERRIWTLLRDRRLAAFKFRRQQVIVPYIVDFICLDARIIIEADGSQHLEAPYDRRRDAFLRGQRFRLLRFWNNDVLKDSDDVATAIFAALTDPHPPTRLAPSGPLPLPKWERG